MKKLKLIFGLLLVAAFVAITVLSYSTNNNQALLKSETIVPRQG
jgi:predicted outer membrane lipoprotein